MSERTLQRPPIRQSILIEATPERTFDVFTRQLVEWWPLVPFSRGGYRVREVDVEERVGGRVVEVWDDGTTVEWGQILRWEPAEHFAMSWNVTGTPTRIDLHFTALGHALTRVDLEHSGWEHLSEAELTHDCALPGGYDGGAFHDGWRLILRRFKDAVDD